MIRVWAWERLTRTRPMYRSEDSLFKEKRREVGGEIRPTPCFPVSSRKCPISGRTRSPDVHSVRLERIEKPKVELRPRFIHRSASQREIGPRHHKLFTDSTGGSRWNRMKQQDSRCRGSWTHAKGRTWRKILRRMFWRSRNSGFFFLFKRSCCLSLRKVYVQLANVVHFWHVVLFKRTRTILENIYLRNDHAILRLLRDCFESYLLGSWKFRRNLRKRGLVDDRAKRPSFLLHSVIDAIILSSVINDNDVGMTKINKLEQTLGTKSKSFLRNRQVRTSSTEPEYKIK